MKQKLIKMGIGFLTLLLCGYIFIFLVSRTTGIDILSMLSGTNEVSEGVDPNTGESVKDDEMSFEALFENGEHLGGVDYTPFGMRFPPEDKICDYSVVTLWWNELTDKNGSFDSSLLDTARECGTRVLVRLSGRSGQLLNDNGVGLDLSKYEEKIGNFSGKIDPYVEEGTIFAHLTIDEPHDCNNDWGGDCPTYDQVEESARISKKYWPNLPTITNTTPEFASKHFWKDIDYINFQYAFHKGDLAGFINDALEVLEDGKVRNVSWSFQVVSGGCEEFGGCPMSPEQVIEVGSAMCNADRGLLVSFSSYKEDLLDGAMYSAIDKVKKECGDPRLYGSQ